MSIKRGCVLAGLLGGTLSCPYIDANGGSSTPPANHPPLPRWTVSAAEHARRASRRLAAATRSEPVGGLANAQPAQSDADAYAAALAALDWAAVKADIESLLTSSDPAWPSDYGHYGPLMVRLAWHNSGSYRLSDGRGGADGARQRFEPERSWEDNTNLDKARTLLAPLKQKYGLGLSHGDLYVLAGTVAVESMGGPILGFCAGRMDGADGAESAALGPSPRQLADFPCGENNANNGACPASSGLGANTVGLIYLNPEGPNNGATPDPELTYGTIRDTFGRMAMNDSETVALIGGGHAFGKTHGACAGGAGPGPRDDPMNPWAGTCTSNALVTPAPAQKVTGRGAFAFTSGFDGPWTTTPTQWDNQYFQNLANYTWTNITGPGGHTQWNVAARVGGGAAETPAAPGPECNLAPGGAAAECPQTQPIMMMTSDVSLTKDANYSKLVAKWATDLASFDEAWKHAWYKLTARDMGPRARCFETSGMGPNFALPPSEPWQHPLPPAPAPADLADFGAVRAAVVTLMTKEKQLELPAQLVKLAYQCAATFRATDWQGGCNGARIRLAAQSAWPANAGLKEGALKTLQEIKDAADEGAYGGGALSWADLIVLAGNAALENQGGDAMAFCGGRTDADTDTEGTGASAALEPRQWGGDAPGKLAYPAVPTQLMYLAERLQLSNRELVVLVGGVHTLGSIENAVNDPTMIARNSTEPVHTPPAGAAWSKTPAVLDNSYYKLLLENDWICADVPAPTEYWYCNQFITSPPITTDDEKATVSMLPTDLLLKFTPELKSVAVELAHADAGLFKAEFAAVWTKLMNSDRFDGPTGNLCTAAPAPAPTPKADDVTPASIGGYAFGGAALLALAGVAAKSRRSGGGGGGGRESLLGSSVTQTSGDQAASV